MNKYIGTKNFYRRVTVIALPLILQMGIANMVIFLDNVMIGQLGTDAMSGVAIVNQLVFVATLCIFGIMSSAGIFGAQFFGNCDREGTQSTFRFKWIAGLFVMLCIILLMYFFQTPLIQLFLHQGGTSGNIENTLAYGQTYLSIAVLALLPYTITQIYATSLQEMSQTFIPMIAGCIAVFIDLTLNYSLIFGHFGAPALGPKGAAIATLIARICECLFIIFFTHRYSKVRDYFKNIYCTFHVPLALTRKIITRGLPLFMNEILFALSMTALLQCYSIKGLATVAAFNINNTIADLFSIIFFAMGNCVSIIVGQLLGAHKMEEAVDTDRKLIAFSVFCGLVMGIFLYLLGPVFPNLYAVSDEVKQLTTRLLQTYAFFMPIRAFIHVSYFTMRTGGKTWITFFFDSFYNWVILIPLVFILTHFTNLSIPLIFIIACSSDIIKVILGFILLKKQVWVNNIIL